jgi:hypothetical protein
VSWGKMAERDAEKAGEEQQIPCFTPPRWPPERVNGLTALSLGAGWPVPTRPYSSLSVKKTGQPRPARGSGAHGWEERRWA